MAEIMTGKGQAGSRDAYDVDVDRKGAGVAADGVGAHTDGAGDAVELRSFGRRRGRRLSERQSQLVDDLLPLVRLAPTGPPPSDLRPQFVNALAFPNWVSPTRSPDGEIRSVWLEVGFGGGEHLIAQAQRHGDIGIIGCEPFIDGVVKVLDAIASDGLHNVRLYDDDCRPLLRWLPPASIDRAFVLFPDPWPKKRHVKRRLVNAGFLTEMARLLKPGAELRIATDIPDYVRTILLAQRMVPDLEWRVASPADWRAAPDDWVVTRYQRKANREGRATTYLRFYRR